MRAARQRTELKEKSLGVPPPPNVSVRSFNWLLLHFHPTNSIF